MPPVEADGDVTFAPDVIDTAQFNDHLTGGAGADTMTGGADSDSYFVDNTGDVIVELAAGGTTDVVRLSVTAVPIPAAAWLFGSAILGLVGVARRRKTWASKAENSTLVRR